MPLKELPEQTVINQAYYQLNNLPRQQLRTQETIQQRQSPKLEAVKTFFDDTKKQSQHIPTKEPSQRQVFPQPIKLPSASQLSVYNRDFNQIRNPPIPDVRERIINAETEQIKNIYQKRQRYMPEPQQRYVKITPEEYSLSLN